MAGVHNSLDQVGYKHEIIIHEENFVDTKVPYVHTKSIFFTSWIMTSCLVFTFLHPTCLI